VKVPVTEANAAVRTTGRRVRLDGVEEEAVPGEARDGEEMDCLVAFQKTTIVWPPASKAPSPSARVMPTRPGTCPARCSGKMQAGADGVRPRQAEEARALADRQELRKLALARRMSDEAASGGVCEERPLDRPVWPGCRSPAAGRRPSCSTVGEVQPVEPVAGV